LHELYMMHTFSFLLSIIGYLLIMSRVEQARKSLRLGLFGSCINDRTTPPNS
jgi:hypothetical protein